MINHQKLLRLCAHCLMLAVVLVGVPSVCCLLSGNDDILMLVRTIAPKTNDWGGHPCTAESSDGRRLVGDHEVRSACEAREINQAVRNNRNKFPNGYAFEMLLLLWIVVFPFVAPFFLLMGHDLGGAVILTGGGAVLTPKTIGWYTISKSSC